MGFHGFRHDTSFGNDYSPIGCSGFRLCHSLGGGGGEQESVADVVAVEAFSVDVENGAYEVGGFLCHGMDVKLHEPVFGVSSPHVSYWQVDEEVVVGLAPLQPCLTL